MLSDVRKMTDSHLIRELSDLIYNGTYEVTGPENENHEVQGFTIPLGTMRLLRNLVDELEYRHVLNQGKVRTRLTESPEPA